MSQPALSLLQSTPSSDQEWDMMPNLFAGMGFYKCRVQLRRYTVLQFPTAIDPDFFQQVREVSTDSLQPHEIGAVAKLIDDNGYRAYLVGKLCVLLGVCTCSSNCCEFLMSSASSLALTSTAKPLRLAIGSLMRWVSP